MSIIQQAYQFVVNGGFIMVPLMLTAFALWYAIGHRWYLLRRLTRQRPRQLFDCLFGIESKISREIPGDPVFKAGLQAVEALNCVPTGEDESPYISEPFDKMEMRLAGFRRLIVTLVTIAPLLGLLGTVIGMIEAFDSITNSPSGDPSAGIASGIAKALYATQFGLVIAIPGMIMGSLLHRKEKRISADLRQIKGLISLYASNKQAAVLQKIDL